MRVLTPNEAVLLRSCLDEITADQPYSAPDDIATTERLVDRGLAVWIEDPYDHRESPGFVAIITERGRVALLCYEALHMSIAS